MKQKKKTALAVILIVVCAGFAIAYLSSLEYPPPQNSQVTLTILSSFDTAIQSAFESAFLSTTFAETNSIVNIDWMSSAIGNWHHLVEAGQADVVWGASTTICSFAEDDLLSALTSPELEAIVTLMESSIAGVALKGNNSDNETVWCATSMRAESFDILVNTTFLDTYSIPVPKSWEDLTNVSACVKMSGSPYIGFINPLDTIPVLRWYHMLTQNQGWDEGWTTMAFLAANAYLCNDITHATDKILHGDIGIAPIGSLRTFLPELVPEEVDTIHLKDQTIVTTDSIAVPAASTQAELAEGFISYILSPEGQSMWLNLSSSNLPIRREAFARELDSREYELYRFYNQTCEDAGVHFNETLFDIIEVPFNVYFEAVIGGPFQNLTQCWSSLIMAYMNGTIDDEQLQEYIRLMGEPISIVDPLSGLSEKFTVEWAIKRADYLMSNHTYNVEVWILYNEAAKQRYLDISSQVEELLILR